MCTHANMQCISTDFNIINCCHFGFVSAHFYSNLGWLLWWAYYKTIRVLLILINFSLKTTQNWLWRINHLLIKIGFRHVFTVKLVVGRGYGMGFTVYVVVGHGFRRGVWWLGLFCRRGCDFGCGEKKKKIIIILLYYNRMYCKIKYGMWDML